MTANTKSLSFALILTLAILTGCGGGGSDGGLRVNLSDISTPTTNPPSNTIVNLPIPDDIQSDQPTSVGSYGGDFPATATYVRITDTSFPDKPSSKSVDNWLRRWVPKRNGNQADLYLQDPKFKTYQPQLEVINAHYAYARGATGKGVKIGIHDDYVDIRNLLNGEFFGRIQFKDSLLAYQHPFAYYDDDLSVDIDDDETIIKPHFGNCTSQTHSCLVFEVAANGDEDKIQAAAIHIIRNYGYPDKNDEWFIRDTSTNENSKVWYEIPVPLGDRLDTHGTYVASAAAGTFFGVAPGATIVPAGLNFNDIWENILSGNELVNASDEDLQKLDTTNSNNYKRLNGVFDVWNSSHGIPSSSEDGRIEDEASQEIFENWWKTYLPKTWDESRQTNTSAANRTIQVYAAGNDSLSKPSVDEATWPDRYPETRGQILTVVAVDTSGSLAWYSNQCGPVPDDWVSDTEGRHYCLAAPGNLNLARPDANPEDKEFQYGFAQGTSFAAPVVSGAVAILMEHFRGQLGNDEIVFRIVDTADNNDYSSDSRPDYSDSNTYGAGLLDLKAATEPVGGNSQTGTQSRQASVASTRLTVPAAYGNPARRIGGIEVAAFDQYNAPFWQPLSTLVNTVNPITNPIPVFEHEPQVEPFGLAMGLTEVPFDDEPVNLLASPSVFGFVNNPNPDWKIAMVAELGANQGGSASGAFGEDVSSVMTWTSWNNTSVFKRVPLNGWRMKRDFTVGFSVPQYESGSMFEASGSVLTSWSIGFTHEDEMQTAKTEISLSQPWRAETGSGTLRFATGRTREGERLYSSHKFDLAPDARAVELKIEQSRKMNDWRLKIEAAWTENHRHVKHNTEGRIGLALKRAF